MRSFCWGFSSSVPNGSKQLYSYSCKVRIRPAPVTTFPRQPRTRGRAGSSGPAPEGAAERGHGGTEREGGDAAAERSCAGAEPGASAVPLQEEVGEKGGSSALVFFDPSLCLSHRTSFFCPHFVLFTPPPALLLLHPFPSSHYTHRGSHCTLLHPSPLLSQVTPHTPLPEPSCLSPPKCSEFWAPSPFTPWMSLSKGHHLPAHPGHTPGTAPL